MKSSTLGQQQFEVLRLPDISPVPGLLRRLGVILAIIAAVTIMLWFTRHGLVDNMHPDREMHFIDVLYFTVVSLTTVGYGDIVPVTPGARFINAVLLTPIRVFLWAVFLGTAYELALQRIREQVQLNQLLERLKDHSIVCGYGVKGRSICRELMAHGRKKEDIIVIEADDDATQRATTDGFVALHGDASSEEILHSAGIDKAAHILVAPERDDVSVLVCLTVRALNSKVRLVASAREEENIKLLYGAGADLVVSPSLSGGRMMGTAVLQPAVTRFVQDMLHLGQGLDIVQHIVTAQESGQPPQALPPAQHHLLLGVARGNERRPFSQLDDFILQEGDVLIYLDGSNGFPKYSASR